MEDMSVKHRNYRIDVLKGFAIIAVVLYHFGGPYLPYGYLGVDVFFTVSGLLMMTQILRDVMNGNFKYFPFIKKRISRLLPLTLIAGAVSLLLGYFNMLPDDFENLAESVVATNFFSNNILACITTKNYWDVVNTVKPLMHTWYLGILLQAYVVFPVFVLIASRIGENKKKYIFNMTMTLTVLSLAAYSLPVFTDAQKFYLLPFRLFEITGGALVAFMIPQAGNRHTKTLSEKHSNLLIYGCVCLLILLIGVPFHILPKAMRLILVTAASVLLLSQLIRKTDQKPSRFMKTFSVLGKCSFSIYLSHQIVFAFIRYMVTEKTDVPVLLLSCAVVAIVSTVFYLAGEKVLGGFTRQHVNLVLAIAILFSMITTAAAMCVYVRAGVVRDVPELSVSHNVYHRGMHAEYCDIPYTWDNDFEDNDKVKIIVIGNSFGRDWANVLHESKYADDLQISYIYSPAIEDIQKRSERFDQMDFLFMANGSENVKDYCYQEYDNARIYQVGDKRYGVSNGIIYRHRYESDYFEQSVELDEQLLRENDAEAKRYGNHYINMISAVQNPDGKVRVFTDDHKFISQDCTHLTQAGAQYYSRILDLSWLVE